MKKYSIILAILFLYAKITFAQNTGKIHGNVISKNVPVEFGSVTLAKSSDSLKFIKFTTTDTTGHFSLDRIENGKYQIRFSSIGYKTTTQNILLSDSKNDINLLNINILADENLLNTVTVTAQKKLIEKTTEGFIINASANITQAGGTATDLLKNTPTVNVDADGGITLRGKTPLILINGRNSNLANPDQIPASSVESIEIINNASAKYDANAESGIINIKLKKNKQDGTNGSFAVGAGFGAKGRLSSALLLKHKKEKWNIGLGYDNRFAGRTRKIIGSRTNFFVPDLNILDQNRNDKRVEALQNLRLNLDFTPNDKNAISFEAIGSKEGQDNDESLNTLIYKQNRVFNSNTNRHSIELARSKVAEFALDFSHKFDNEQKKLTASLSTSLNYDRENTNITSQAYLENEAATGNPFLQRTHNYENGYISNAKLDYSFPLSETAEIETGYKGIFRSINADFETADKINNSYIINNGSSNIFDFSEQVNALYAQLNSYFGEKQNPKWKYNLGLRAEQVANNGKTQNSSTNFSNNYVKLFPTASLVHYVKADKYWKLSYGKRINRPSLGQLNPFTDITDALNPHSGNPNLKPEIIHALELGYNNEWKTSTFSTNIFYRYAKNTIRQYYKLQADGVNLLLPENIGNATTYGLENVFSTKLSPIYDFNLSLSLFEQHINSQNLSANLDNDVVQNAFGWNAKIINNITPFQNGKLQIVGNYNSALATPQGNRIAQYFVDLGFQQKLGKAGSARLGVTLVDAFNTLKNGFVNNTPEFSNFRNVKVDTRAIMFTFGYSFRSAFKEKIMENQFSREY